MSRSAALFAKDIVMPARFLHEELAEELNTEVRRRRGSTRGVSAAIKEEQLRVTKWLIECLYQGFCCIPRRPVAVSLSPNAFGLGKEGRVQCGYTTFRRVLDTATELGWVTVVKGSESHSLVSRLWPDGRLLKWFEALGINWQWFEARETGTVVTQDRKGKGWPGKLPHYPAVNIALASQRLHVINDHLLQQAIYLDCPDAELMGIGRSLSKPVNLPYDFQPLLNFSRVALRRIFSRNSFELGGRFFDGWWQSIPSEFRRSVVINDWPTVEMDFSGMALSCLYAMDGLDMGAGC